MDPSGGGDPIYGLIEGGWGYRNGGKGAETYWGEIAYGGGGAGASKTVAGSSSAGSSSNTNGGAGESYYNPNFVSDYTYMAPQAGNGQVQISWGE